jgi:hypothetical protein
MSGWVGKRFSFLNVSACLKSSYDYFSRFRLLRTNARLFIEVPISGWFGKRFS